MKKIKFMYNCMDKYTRVNYTAGDVHEFEDARADEIVATGYAKVVTEFATKMQEAEELAEETVEEKVQEAEVSVEETVEDDEEKPLKLSELSKDELVALAKEYGVATRGTKADIIKRLLDIQN